MTLDSQQYAALRNGVGFAELRDWTQIELTGADRLKFLNNFCTADLQKLSPGQGTEAFICNVKGKVLGYVYIYCGDDAVMIETVPGQASMLIPHLDRYTLRDDVTLRDVSSEYPLLVVAGEKSTEVLSNLAGESLPTQPFSFGKFQLSGVNCTIGRHILLGKPTYLLCVSKENLAPLIQLLTSAGAVACEADVIDARRIEAGVPLFGRDITIENLPQEVNRNAQAISFTKGCYLGQETVARIDALGHVNRVLVGVQFFGEEVPAPAAELQIDGKPVGHVTSATFSPRLSRPLALAYVRTENAAPGTRLLAPSGDVIALPVC